MIVSFIGWDVFRALRTGRVAFAIGCAILLSLPLCAAPPNTPAGNNARAKTTAQSIVFVDSSAAVLQLSRANGKLGILSQDEWLAQPFGVAVLSDGEIVVSDTGIPALVRVNVATGSQTILARNATLGVPYGVASDNAQNVYVANGHSVVAVNSRSGTSRVLSTRGLLLAPLGVCAGNGQFLFVADVSGRIIRIHTITGQQRLISAGGSLMNPVSIVHNNGQLYVGDLTGRRIVSISATTGKQKVVARGNFLTTPVGLAMLDSNTLLVGDPDCNNYKGGILQINLLTGAQQCIVTGFDDFTNPRGIAVASSWPKGKASPFGP